MLAKSLFAMRVNFLRKNIRFTSNSVALKEPVITNEVNENGLIILNRPKVLNVLNMKMVEILGTALNDWNKSKSVIVVRGNGGKAFCAGGDLRNIVESGDIYTFKMAKVEYSMSHLIANLNVPYVALIDGITMGGGVGIAVNGKYRIATEKTVFAMPETKIGDSFKKIVDIHKRKSINL